MGRAISAISGSAVALLPRPFALLKPALLAFWHEMTRDMGTPLPARTALYARPRPEMARQARPAPGSETPYLFESTGSKLAPLRNRGPGARSNKELVRMVRAAILDDYQNVALKVADWSAVGKDVEVKVFNAPLGDDDAVIKALQGFAIVNMMRERTPFTRKVIEGLPDLKLLITTGARNNSIDMKAAAERGVTVCGTGGFGNPTAGIAIGLMLELTRHIGFENARLKAGAPWQVTIGQDLEGLTLGVLGLGKLGQRVADVAKALGMKVIAWSQNLTPEKAKEAGATTCPRKTCSARPTSSPSIVVLSDRSRGLVGAKELGLMKKTAYLINTSRGPIVDEKALIAALDRQVDRRRRPRRVRHRAAAARSSVPQDGQRRDHAASRLCQRTELPRAIINGVVEDIRAWLDGKPVRVIAAK